MKKLEIWRKRSHDALPPRPVNVPDQDASQPDTMVDATTEAELHAALKLLMVDCEDTVPAAFYRNHD